MFNLKNLNVQELSLEDQIEIDGGWWPLIPAAVAAYVAVCNYAHDEYHAK